MIKVNKTKETNIQRCWKVMAGRVRLYTIWQRNSEIRGVCDYWQNQGQVSNEVWITKTEIKGEGKRKYSVHRF